MNDLITLLHREWLEHRNTFILAPAGFLTLIIVVVLFGVFMGQTLDVKTDLEDRIKLPSSQDNPAPPPARQYQAVYQEDTQSAPIPVLQTPGAQPAALDELYASASVSDLVNVLDGLAKPFMLLFILVATMTAVSLTYDERKDRSLLFWKSMPVSDLMTVTAKFLFLAWVAPLATLAAIVIARFILAGVAIVYVDDLTMAAVWTDHRLWTGLLGLVTGYLLFGLWAAPVYAWLLLVGAVARRSPLMLATVIPLALFFLEWQALDSLYLLRFFIDHTLPSPLYSQADGFAAQFGLLVSANFWIGILVATAFLAGTVFARRRCNEL